MCNRTDCYGSAFGPLACSVCREKDMSMTELTDAELARLEELAGKATPGEWYESVTGEGVPSVNASAEDAYHGFSICIQGMIHNTHNITYIAAACNAVPSLVAEVRRLREALDAEHSAWRVAEVRGDGLEMENAALRDRVEALEWLREVEAYALDASIFELRQGAIGELEYTYDAAREAVK